jgi:hypothetical protein
MEYQANYKPITGNDNVVAILDAAITRWLTVEEIIKLLSDDKCGPFLPRQMAPPPQPPPSGTVLLYNRFAVRNYKKDGHDWIRKRSNPVKVREDHVKLRYKGEFRVGGNYVHSDTTESFHRRVYRLLKTAEEKAASDVKEELVLVHYLDTAEAAKISLAAAMGPQSPSYISAGINKMCDPNDMSSPYSSYTYNDYMQWDGRGYDHTMQI